MIGLVGHPNVGKSSMVNYILGRKAVSVKATPGHTKTLQTLILDEHTCLCDSPGLVFPRTDVSLAEQIIGGLVPLPVVREPYSATRWLAEARDATGAVARDGRRARIAARPGSRVGRRARHLSRRFLARPRVHDVRPGGVGAVTRKTTRKT